MTKPWFKSTGKLVISDTGKLIFCDVCPCDGGSEDYWFVGRQANAASGIYRLYREDGSLKETLNHGYIQCCDDEESYYTIISNTVSKYDSEDNLLWTYTETELQLVLCCDVDSNYNVYICGYHTDGYSKVVKIDPEGDEVWANTIFEEDWAHRMLALSVDASGNVAAVGVKTNTPDTPTTYGWSIYYYDSDGIESWHDDVPTAPGPGNEFYRHASSCCFDSSGNLYVGFDTTLADDTTDKTLEKYNSSGVSQWTKDLGDESHVTCLEISPDGKLLVGFANAIGSGESSGSSARIRQYSGANHATEDWTVILSDNSIEIDAAYDVDGEVYAVISSTSPKDSYYKLNGDTGSEVYSGRHATPSEFCCVGPGRVPNFM